MPPSFSPSCTMNNRPTIITGTDRDRVQHDRRADRRVVVGAEERRGAEPERLVKAADAARRRHGDANHQRRQHQPRRR